MISETVNYKCVLNHYPRVRAQVSLIMLDELNNVNT